MAAGHQIQGPRLATDCIVADEAGNLVLIRRRNEPFKGSYALPGGFVEAGETIEDACRREVKEETNLEIYDMRLVGVYSGPGRDPRGHVVSVAFRGGLLQSRCICRPPAAFVAVIYQSLAPICPACLCART